MDDELQPAVDGCGCQYDAAGRRFRTRCICPPEPTPEQTLRAVAGLGGAIGDAVATLLARDDKAAAVVQAWTAVPLGTGLTAALHSALDELARAHEAHGGDEP